MTHIFVFDSETRLYANGFSCDKAREALERGIFYYKIDGSNGLIVVADPEQDEESAEDGGNIRVTTTEDDDGKKGGTTPITMRAYQRLDTKGKAPPPGCIRLPSNSNNRGEGGNPESYEGHSYYYEPIKLDAEVMAKKKLRKRNQAMLRIVQDHADYFVSLTTRSRNGNGGDDAKKNYVSVEWVGRKFNRTPGVPHDVAIAVHAEQLVPSEEVARLERTYDGMKKALLLLTLEVDNNDTTTTTTPPPVIEGYVVEYEGTYWKIRADCFDRRCPFKERRDGDGQVVRPPVALLVSKNEADDERAHNR